DVPHLAVAERGDVGGARAVAVLEVPGQGGRVDDADGGGAVAVPVPHHRKPVLAAVGERGDVGRAGRDGVLQEPRGGRPGGLGGRAADAGGVGALAVPVAGHREPVGGAVGERGHVGGARRVAVADVPGRGRRVEGRDRGAGRGGARLVEGRRGDAGQAGDRGDQRVAGPGLADGQVVEGGQAGGVGGPRQRAAEFPAARVGAQGDGDGEGAADGCARGVLHLHRDGRADDRPDPAAGRLLPQGQLLGSARLVEGRRGDGGQAGGRGDQRVAGPGCADGQVVEGGQAGGGGGPRQRAAEHAAARVGAEGHRNREGAADGFAR